MCRRKSSNGCNESVQNGKASSSGGLTVRKLPWWRRWARLQRWRRDRAIDRVCKQAVCATTLLLLGPRAVHRVTLR